MREDALLYGLLQAKSGDWLSMSLQVLEFKEMWQMNTAKKK